MRARIARLQLVEFRPFADEDLAAGKIEVEEGGQVLLHRDVADAEEERSREGRRFPRSGRNRAVSTPRVQGFSRLNPRARRSSASDFVATEGSLAEIVEGAQPAIGPGLRYGKAGAEVFGKPGMELVVNGLPARRQ